MTHAVVDLENPADVSVTSSRRTSQRAVLKLIAATEAIPASSCPEPSPKNQIMGPATSDVYQAQG